MDEYDPDGVEGGSRSASTQDERRYPLVDTASDGDWPQAKLHARRPDTGVEQQALHTR